ncbi:hypothetical protein [Pseudomonas sp. SR18]|uniref:hypothetical protein n=1 Tax=Pseudomonas sp. SR18 TaxID=1461074 RepID=UPI0020334E8B|nr:hypothetical protein [Pseudomonas sp. SR18]MCM2364099.1 hypothetical protein [Pseudomonas sp. SR18]
MPRDFMRSGVPDAHTTTRQRLTSLLDLPKLYRTVDADPAIVGAGLVHIGSDYQVTVLREFVPLCSIKPKRVILREVTGPMMAADDYAQWVANSPRESHLWALPKRFSNVQLRQDLLIQLADQVGAALAVTGSGLSGNINSLVIGIYEEFGSHEQ